MFRKALFILSLMICFLSRSSAEGGSDQYCFEFYESTYNLEVDRSVHILSPLELKPSSITAFYTLLNGSKYQPIVDSMLAYRARYQLNDWLYYQLIRRISQQISPKAENYTRYTLYKWFFLSKSGYDARLAIAGDKIIFYVYNDEDIADIPFFMVDNKKYMCLNIHDYPKADLHKNPPLPVRINLPDATRSFSYKITRLPDFKPENYKVKKIEFRYKQKTFHFAVKLNPEIEKIFANYPSVDFESYFNIPLSKGTYGSLIPMLKQNVDGMSQKKGVDYLMRFTRYAFLYEDDEENFGKEKRLSAEETLFAKYSDCDDRAALFFYLVKEIYNLPMIAVLYPTHITMAVRFDKAIGKPIIYEGKAYSICEPTPQEENLQIGQISRKLKNLPYKIVYQYEPPSF
ncbi:hypothetical protein B0I27_10940 [Arcticibacter pallidicorallinus]|uniref:Transglutaminase superfamily protein n=2 Tax=Arcticibacter pallidicorallinus TaxID=1259464 RepID=A0A2T0TXC7_9SPHI|nr:hypothetical protein B0I27_10940 [Arcticibacter pallidicorallinus]